MNLCQNVCHRKKKRTELKVGHVGSETMTLGWILEKSFVPSSRHSFEPICMKLCQNVWHHEIDKIETGSKGQNINLHGIMAMLETVTSWAKIWVSRSNHRKRHSTH